MVKQSCVVTSSDTAPAAAAVVLKVERVLAFGSRWKGLGRATGVFTAGLLAVFAAPREAKAVGYFVDNTATSFGVGAQQPCGDTLYSGNLATPGCYTSWLEL